MKAIVRLSIILDGWVVNIDSIGACLDKNGDVVFNYKSSLLMKTKREAIGRVKSFYVCQKSHRINECYLEFNVVKK
jgi:hypothetical protein